VNFSTLLLEVDQVGVKRTVAVAFEVVGDEFEAD
jgi:hypothetical protein